MQLIDTGFVEHSIQEKPFQTQWMRPTGSADQEAAFLRTLLSEPNNIETRICFVLSAQQ